MKKLLPVIPAFIILGICSVVFVLMCLPQNPEIQYETVNLDMHFLRTRGVYIAVLGGLLFTALNNLAFYFFRKRETGFLLFAMLCSVYAVHSAFSPAGLNSVFVWIPEGEITARLNFATLTLFHNTGTWVGLYNLWPDWLRKYKIPLAAYLVFGLLLSAFAPVSFISSQNVKNTWMSVSCVAIFAFFAKSPVLKADKWVRLYFLSYALFMLFGPLQNQFMPNTFFAPGLTPVLFMILANILLLSNRYAGAFTLAEEYSANLELTVSERTHNLKVTNDAMKELLSNISHDLKTPLAVMSLNLESLSSLATSQADANYQRHVRAAYQKNLDLQRLIQNLLDVSRLETGQELFKPKWEPLLALLVRAKEKYNDYIEDQGLSFDIEAEIPGSLEIYADPQKVWSVFDNIIYNAVRHTQSGGITIYARREGNLAKVTIADTGSGIEAKHLPHVFERFYKGSDARNAGNGESGLGLYIVKSVMDACGGSAEIKSVTGEGTQLCLTFKAGE
jgi:signal transduction histidine kinase